MDRQNTIGWSAVLVVAVVFAALLIADGDQSDETSSVVTATSTERPLQRLAVLGDSYSAGQGAGDPNLGYVPDLAKAMCWTVVANEAAGGTGYVNPMPTAPAYPLRVDTVIDAKPDIVIVQGSTNDASLPNEAIFTAATGVYATIRSSLPEVKIVVIGPALPPKSNAANVQAARDAVKQAADQLSAPFLDPIAEKWLPNPSLFAVDQIHPTAAGHQRFADSAAADLKRDGIPSSCGVRTSAAPAATG